MTPYLRLDNVSRTFGRGNDATHALKNVSLEVVSGQSMGIVGESGAGKSTILKLLMALDRPSAGRVLYRGDELAHRNRAVMRDFRSNVQIVFQDPRSSLDPRMNVGAIIAEPLRSLSIPGDHTARVHEVLRWVGLDEDAASKYPAQFSGGQRQRIAIARALAPSPQVLVADEPVSALDVSVRSQIIELLQRLKHELGMTLIMVSHDMAIVGQLCEQTVVLRDGVIEETGATRDVLTNPQADYTKKLLAAVPQLPTV
ncbi:ABC transporter ATP-binding protein [Populibacterium corticicola]|jgi:peptide/nickel transport system ATP-binding protein|uniref:ABC transporter ATP-binding protein n=1 Tax=Populibacterium corticicola TaxID=1812826 RepID=A0ABW5XFK8_9MICO